MIEFARDLEANPLADVFAPSLKSAERDVTRLGHAQQEAVARLGPELGGQRRADPGLAISWRVARTGVKREESIVDATATRVFS